MIYVQVKHHKGKTDEWAIHQIDSYKNQKSDKYENNKENEINNINNQNNKRNVTQSQEKKIIIENYKL